MTRRVGVRNKPKIFLWVGAAVSFSPSTCRRQVEMLGMTKGRMALPFGVMVVMTASQALSFLPQLAAGKGLG
jgi:hypothetical protein